MFRKVISCIMFSNLELIQEKLNAGHFTIKWSTRKGIVLTDYEMVISDT